MRIDSLPSTLLGLLVIFQSGEGSILLGRIRNFGGIQGVIRGTAEALHRGGVWRQAVRWGAEEGDITGEELVQLRVLHVGS